MQGHPVSGPPGPAAGASYSAHEHFVHEFQIPLEVGVRQVVVRFVVECVSVQVGGPGPGVFCGNQQCHGAVVAKKRQVDAVVVEVVVVLAGNERDGVLGIIVLRLGRRRGGNGDGRNGVQVWLGSNMVEVEHGLDVMQRLGKNFPLDTDAFLRLGRTRCAV